MRRHLLLVALAQAPTLAIVSTLAVVLGVLIATGRVYGSRFTSGALTAYVEPAAADAPIEAQYQFERHGYFVADRRDHAPGAPDYNRAVTLRDSWGK